MLLWGFFFLCFCLFFSFFFSFFSCALPRFHQHVNHDSHLLNFACIALFLLRALICIGAGPVSYAARHSRLSLRILVTIRFEPPLSSQKLFPSPPPRSSFFIFSNINSKSHLERSDFQKPVIQNPLLSFFSFFFPFFFLLLMTQNLIFFGLNVGTILFHHFVWKNRLEEHPFQASSYRSLLLYFSFLFLLIFLFLF